MYDFVHNRILLPRVSRLFSGFQLVFFALVHTLLMIRMCVLWLIFLKIKVGTTLALVGMQDYRDIDPVDGFSSAFQAVGYTSIKNIVQVAITM